MYLPSIFFCTYFLPPKIGALFNVKVTLIFKRHHIYIIQTFYLSIPMTSYHEIETFLSHPQHLLYSHLSPHALQEPICKTDATIDNLDIQHFIYSKPSASTYFNYCQHLFHVLCSLWHFFTLLSPLLIDDIGDTIGQAPHIINGENTFSFVIFNMSQLRNEQKLSFACFIA